MHSSGILSGSSHDRGAGDGSFLGGLASLLGGGRGRCLLDGLDLLGELSLFGRLGLLGGSLFAGLALSRLLLALLGSLSLAL